MPTANALPIVQALARALALATLSPRTGSAASPLCLIVLPDTLKTRQVVLLIQSVLTYY